MNYSSACLLVGVSLTILGCDDDAADAPPSPSSSSASASAAATGTPKIVAAEPVFEFGKVKLGTTVEHVFKVKNAGTGPLQIARAKGS
ncbi:MAG TPA: DUF1573 domain-containing protein [Polyangiaceae bacterium]|nr:DUF1573 domain-containing protein [Polyangiaceae bacterium]